jgi:alkaline phosphatase
VSFSRRDFLAGGALALWGSRLPELPVLEPPTVFGLVTDVHFALAPAKGTRFYAESLKKLAEATAEFRKAGAHCVIELGDLIDSAPGVDAAGETQFLEMINREFVTGAPKQGYVLGNHCLSTVPRKDFLATINRPAGHQSFEVNGWQIVILDACYKLDGTPYEPGNFTWNNTSIPDWQIAWLESELKSSRAVNGALVFCHQKLDWVADTRPDLGVGSAAKVRSVMEQSGRVKAVFMGHTHQNELKTLNSIPYITLRAMVEGTGEASSAYALLHAYRDGTLLLRGMRDQDSHKLRMA